ncbi:MAG: alpha/beta hydrolase [Deltaproteobacteria bacterium]|nr:alpha/beta hydrolase [Deltaproteobacteria bacterium]
MRPLLRTLAILALFPYAGVALLVVTGAATWSSIAYVAAIGLLLGGLVTLPDPAAAPSSEDTEAAQDPQERKRRRSRPRGLSRGGALAVVAVMSVRTCTTDGGRGITVATSDGSSSRVVNRIVDEADVAILGARLLGPSGLYGADSSKVAPAMRDAYARMRRDQGAAATPFVATYLGLQRPAAFDTIVIEPASRAAAKTALIFLHGYAGNFDMPCWQMAKAVDGLDVVTACPSTSWVGDWWSADGEAILDRTVEMLRARGVSRFVLAGLSNGGYGASELAPRRRGTFAGLVLVSGARPDQPSPGVPVLLVHGTHDNMVPIEEARAYRDRHGGRLVELPAGHFALLLSSTDANRAIHDFVASLVQNGSIRTSTESVSGPPPT